MDIRWNTNIDSEMYSRETELTTKLSNQGMSWWGILGIALRLIDLSLRAHEEGKLEMPTGADKIYPSKILSL